MKKYNAINLDRDVSRPEWADGLKTIKINDLSNDKIDESDENICNRLKMLRERREKCNQDSRSLAASTLCRD